MALLCVVRKSERWNTRWTWLQTLVVLPISFYLLLIPAFAYSWGLSAGLGWLSVLVAASLFFWAGFATQVRPSQLPKMTTVLLIVCGGSAVIVGISGSVILSQLAAVQASTLGAGLLVNLWRRESVLGNSGLLHLVLFSGLIVTGWYFVEVPARSIAVLMTVPWLATQMSRRVPKSWPGWAHLLAITAVSLVAVSIACYLAVISSPPLDL
jgi:hypothetical protein